MGERLRRSPSGVSLTELMVASILLGFVCAGVGEIMVLCVYSSTKQYNLNDVRIGVRRALELIKSDVRTSYAIDPRSTPAVLRLVIPAFYVAPENNPQHASYDPVAPQNPLNGVPVGSPNTIIYGVRQDPDKPSEFLLEVTTEPATTSRIIAKGIVGPFAVNDSDGLPDLFVYLKKATNPAVLPQVTELDPNGVMPYPPDGVAINFELKRPEKTDEVGPHYVSTLGVRGEAFVRALDVSKLPGDIYAPVFN